jgi:hypothetical protein
MTDWRTLSPHFCAVQKTLLWTALERPCDWCGFRCEPLNDPEPSIRNAASARALAIVGARRKGVERKP